MGHSSVLIYTDYTDIHVSQCGSKYQIDILQNCTSVQLQYKCYSSKAVLLLLTIRQCTGHHHNMATHTNDILTAKHI